MPRCVYLLKDFEGCVRYVGSSRDPNARFAAHKSADSKIGRFIRAERSAGRGVELVVDLWYADDEAALEAERQAIWGYSKLVGSKLFNHVSREPIFVVHEVCIRQNCNLKANHRGLCSRHTYEYYGKLYELDGWPKVRFEELCVERGLIAPKDPEPETIEDIFQFVLDDVAFEKIQEPPAS